MKTGRERVVPMPTAKKYRAIVAHFDPKEQERIARLLRQTDQFEVILLTHSGEECILQAVQRKPDLVVTEALLSGVDGLEVMRQIKKRCSGTKCLFLTNYSVLMENQLAVADADYCILTPYAGSVLAARAVELVQPAEDIFSIQSIHDMTVSTLSVLGVPPRLKGYVYLKDGVQISVRDPNAIRRHSGSDGLYAQLCSRHHATYRNIEHCIRYVSDYIHTNTALDVLEQYFTPADLKRDHIPNITLISTLAARVSNDLRALKSQDAIAH